MNRSIMSVGAHADDIEIQTGGTLLKYRDLGYEVIYVMATNNMSGAVSERLPDGTRRKTHEGPVDMMARRKGECDDAAAALGTTPIHLDHPQRHYNPGPEGERLELRYGCVLPEGVPENVPSILTAAEDPASVTRLADLIQERDPECILTHGVAQHNVEHFATGLLTTVAFWQAAEQGYRGALLHWREAHKLHGDFNCRWETFVDCTRYLDEKAELIGRHRCQMPMAGDPDFAHKLMTQYRGQACGCGAAELFTWVRRSQYRDDTGAIAYPPLTLELVRNTR
ncbi:MAG: PIG-L family deacetylase [Kiritimatiellae bacterium]|nr:PIG-L family deacetylase [Kiritimatiellia bacterium]